MSDSMKNLENIIANIHVTIADVSAASVLGMVLETLTLAMRGIDQAFESQPDLQPELLATANAIKEAADAIGRAHDFLIARTEVTFE